MVISGNRYIWLVLLIIGQTSAIFYNRPKLSPCASWNPNATTFADNNTVGYQPLNVFVDLNDSVYVTATNLSQVVVWSQGNNTPTRIISNNLNTACATFVTSDGNVYVDNGQYNKQVDMWTLNATNGVNVVNVTSRCLSLFIDINNTLYCVNDAQNKIVKTSLNTGATTVTLAAGNGTQGSGVFMLHTPAGIFVDFNLTLYVADYGNNRIQYFQAGQLNGSTIVLNGPSGILTLNHPTDVVLDFDGYLFITDADNNRIIGSGPGGYYCVVGCTGISGATSNQLNHPQALAFDSYGNLFVVDQSNNRIQKFSLATNSCATSYNRPKFSSCASWNPNGITFADNSTVGFEPVVLFVDINNTVYVAATNLNQILVWPQGNNMLTQFAPVGLNNSLGMFVADNGNIYVDNGMYKKRVDMWTSNGTYIVAIMNVTDRCMSLFIDIYDTLYCANDGLHRVVKASLTNGSNATTLVAGTGAPGSNAYSLIFPNGIFVDFYLNLYVADLGNNRIQFFQAGQSYGSTLVGNGSSQSIVLNNPSDVILDFDGHLFIADSGNHRIIGSGPNGYYCIVGCTGSSGTASNQLYHPHTIAFDNYGNLFVVDQFNSRIQKFPLTINSCGVSYNQPKFSPCASWNPDAITLANGSIVGSQPYDLFVDLNNTIYVTATSLNQVLVWPQNSSIPTQNISAGLNTPCGIFVTSNNDIYVDNGQSYGHVEMWTSNVTNSVDVMNVTSKCVSLFIDKLNTLYCANDGQHQVVKVSLNTGSTRPTLVAGNGTAGADEYMLHNPNGIFVDFNLTLYVADYENHRIQFFQAGEFNASTIVLSGPSGILTLNHPTDVVLDFNGHLFITDADNNRIIGSGPGGYYCIVGCTGSNGTASNQLYHPQALAFDSYGNLFMTDQYNSRIQKFLLASNSCDQSTTDEMTTLAIATTTRFQEELTTTIETASTTISNSNQSCVAPLITLIPGGSSLSSPIQFQRNQDFSIISNIQLQCNSSLAITTKWTIKNCTAYCSSPISFDSFISTTSSELYIPPRTLPIGKYQLTLTVTMVASFNLTSSSSAYVTIVPSGIIVNLIPFATSMMTIGYQQNLTLNPGLYSIDLDEGSFNSTDWNYEYYCRIYGVYNFSNVSGVLLTIGDPRISSLNQSCLSNQSRIQYSPSQSSLTIFSQSLSPNRTYQFMVHLSNHRNTSIQSTGYLLVQVDSNYHPLIGIGCVISTMCVPNQEFQFVNPTTQVALYSLCFGTCTSIQNIIWNVYQGYKNISSSVVQWTLFNQMTNYQNIWFFGMNTGNFTSTNQLFLANPAIEYWRFEVVYSFASSISSSSINFVLNQPPSNGSCSIHPLNGTTSTLFTISCSNWIDQNGIKDYSFYVWTSDPSNLLMIGFSSVSTVNVQLPAGDAIHLIVHIRNTHQCVTEYNMSSVTVLADTIGINNLINNLQVSTSAVNQNPIVQLLASTNQNTVGQVITSLSQVFNDMNIQSIQNAVSNGIPAASISVSSLASERTIDTNSIPLNQSALIEYNKQVNIQANLRDYLIPFITKSSITTANSIKLQSSTLSQLTQATNQLTRTTTLLASNKCYQLAVALNSMMFSVSYEDALSAATQISECTNNVITAINGPLQQRTTVLDLDFSRANQFPEDYDTDLESDWSNLNLFADGSDFSTATIEKNRNLYNQKRAAQQIANQVSQISALVSSALNIHLNIGQNIQINSSSLFMSLETRLFQSIEQVGNARIHLPLNFSSNNQTVSLRSMMQPLAVADQSKSQSNTNLSRSISLSILDQNGNEVSIQTNSTNPIELLIPRDPNAIIPPMYLQNVTSTSSYQLFNYHYVSITSVLPISVHFEIHPLDSTVGYLFIYKFDGTPQLNQSDGWRLFCSSNGTNDTLYTYFIDNEQTWHHQSIVFGLREVNCSNTSSVNALISNERFNFTSNYELRVYTSGCYYLDQNNNWQSDGLKVGPLTNHYQTQCYSTHLTTFTTAFLVLPSPINWNSALVNGDFIRNKTANFSQRVACEYCFRNYLF